jgi:hypothetical protein
MSQIRAFVVAVETYQGGNISPVEFAEADAVAVSESLKYSGVKEDDIVVLLSATATKTTVESKLKTFMRGVNENDQLFFFYAGHGFSENGSNYITCHDTQPEDASNSSISLQNLFQQLRVSPCRRIILFLDSCHSGAPIFDGMRHLFARRSDSELQELVANDQYCIAFASCKSDESSYSKPDLSHGVWTYHLVRALRGEDSSALKDNRFLTGLTLQEFLFRSVQATIKSMFSGQRVQTPCMFGNLTQDFLIADFAQGTGTPLTGWPEMTTDEWSVYSSVLAKAMEEPFTENDLSRLKEVMQAYHERTKTECTETQIALGVWLNEAVMKYHFELSRCVLIAFDNKQPFFSQDLQRAIQQVRQLGLRESKIEADLRRILSTAHQTPWIDEFGKAYHPLTREEILDGMKRWEMAQDNFSRLFSLMKEWTSSCQRPNS